MWGLVGPLLTIRDTEGEGGYIREIIAVQVDTGLPQLLMSAINNVKAL